MPNAFTGAFDFRAMRRQLQEEENALLSRIRALYGLQDEPRGYAMNTHTQFIVAWEPVLTWDTSTGSKMYSGIRKFDKGSWVQWGDQKPLGIDGTRCSILNSVDTAVFTQQALSQGKGTVKNCSLLIDDVGHAEVLYTVTYNGRYIYLFERSLKKSEPPFLYGIELEGMVKPSEYDFFRQEVTQNRPVNFTQDGSIRLTRKTGNWNALEIRTEGGISSECIDDIAHSIEASGHRHQVGVNSSCGFHLHISHPAMLTASFLYRMVYFWCAIEDVIFSTQPPSRQENHYCKSSLVQFLQKSHSLPEAKEQLISELGEYDRYQALNLASMVEHSTIEIRLHSGTFRAEKIIAWKAFMTAIMEYCMNRYKPSQVKKLFEERISMSKIESVFKLLHLSPETTKHFLDRIGTFGWERMNTQRPKILAIVGQKQKEQALKKKLIDLQKVYDKTLRELHDQDQHADDHRVALTDEEIL